MRAANKNFEWKKSPRHIDLLSKFENGRDPAQVMDWQYLRDTLGEPVKKALDRFIAEDMLVQASLEDKIRKMMTVADLKEMLRERDLRLSGNKDHLISRLINYSRAAMENLANKNQIIICSPQAVKVIKSFEEEKLKAREATRKTTFMYLTEGDIKRAYQEYVNFVRAYSERDYHSTEYMAESLEYVLAACPDALSMLSANDLGVLRAAVAASKLWGDRDSAGWLPDDFSLVEINNERALAYLSRSAHFQESAANITQYGDTKIRIVFSPYDVDSCDKCKEFEGSVFGEKAFPNLPLEGCSSEKGCQCKLEPVHEPIEANINTLLEEEMNSPAYRLQQLKKMLDLELISQDEYDQKKHEILEEL